MEEYLLSQLDTPVVLKDGITMLDGWQHSRGARLEKATAEIFNIKEL